MAAVDRLKFGLLAWAVGSGGDGLRDTGTQKTDTGLRALTTFDWMQLLLRPVHWRQIPSKARAYPNASS